MKKELVSAGLAGVLSISTPAIAMCAAPHGYNCGRCCCNPPPPPPAHHTFVYSNPYVRNYNMRGCNYTVGWRNSLNYHYQAGFGPCSGNRVGINLAF